MSQDEYARLLVDRNHSRHRGENQPVVSVLLQDLDREEILDVGARNVYCRDETHNLDEAWRLVTGSWEGMPSG